MSRRPEPDGGASTPRPDTPTLIRRRAELLARTRAFFAARGVLEVDPPLLARGLVVDAHIDPVTADLGPDAGTRYLLPSPEAPLKRLLADGSGPIYALGSVFRQGERGRRHRPEFTMLEWYRPGMPYDELMDEVGALARELLGAPRWLKRTYRDVFLDVLGVDPHAASAADLAAVATDRGVAFAGVSDDVPAADWLDLLYAACIEPALDPAVPTFVYDFTAAQAALAELSDDTPPVARRFELVFGGLELCNGYQELLDPGEHRRRFAAANVERKRVGKAPVKPDDHLLAALERGLPQCSGVALGFDRIVMLATGASDIGDVLPCDDRGRESTRVSGRR